jgi:hypothetical protein
LFDTTLHSQSCPLLSYAAPILFLYCVPNLAGLAALPVLPPQVDPRSILSRLLDGSRFEEFKAEYGKTLVTGG